MASIPSLKRPVLLAAYAATLTAGCATGTVAKQLAGEAPRAAEALEEPEMSAIECASIGRARPLVVDWGSQDRLDLELTMRERVAVVHYGCDGLKLLPSCTLAGGYRFAGVSRKEEIVQLSSADELAANLPFSAVKLQAEMKRDSAIDLALVMVGKHVTSVREGPRILLEGDCDGATHFVHAAYVGAFAMDRGTKGKARALVDVFGRGGKASSDYQSRRATKDGSVDACRASKSRDVTPPEQCASTLRVELYPLTDAKPAAGAPSAGAEAPSATGPACPAGMVERNDVCVQPETKEDTACPRDDVAACRRRCDADDAESCYRLAVIHRAGRGVEKNLVTAMALHRKGCDLGLLASCREHYYASTHCELEARKAKADVGPCEVDQREAFAEAACEKGEPKSCGIVARMSISHDQKRYRTFMQRACDLGDAVTCTEFAMSQLSGHYGIERDVAAALATLERGCEGSDFMSCATLATVFKRGQYGVTPDLARASLYEEQLCAKKNAIGSCVMVAKRYRDAPPGVSRNRKKAMRFFRHACKMDDSKLAGEACHALAEMLRFQRLSTGKGLTEAQKSEAVETYFEGCRKAGKGCDFAITLTQQRAFRHDKKKCVEGDAEACERLQVSLADDGCGHGHERQCKQLGALAPSRLQGRCIMSRKPESVPCNVWRLQGGDVPSFPAE